MCQPGSLEEPCTVHLKERFASASDHLNRVRMQHNIAGSTPPTQDEYDEAVFGWGLTMYNIILSERTEEKASQLRAYMRRSAKSEVVVMRDSASGMGGKKSPETSRDIDKYEYLYVRFLECDALANADHRMQVVSEESRYFARKYSAAAFAEMDVLRVKITAALTDFYR